MCYHNSLFKFGRMKKWGLSMVCADCGDFWIWNKKTRTWRLTGSIGGLEQIRLDRMKAKRA